MGFNIQAKFTGAGVSRPGRPGSAFRRLRESHL